MFPIFYDALGISAHIERYGPENRYKAGFEATTREERLRLFGEIVTAVHASGEGLETLTYHDPQGRPIDRLLRSPEVAHLQDVADLVARITPVGWLSVAWMGVHLLLVRLLAWPVPPLRRLLGASVVATFGALLLVLAIGPRRVFYAMHEWVFPPENPWFFYYQDSLMSTMMKAPDLFGGIAAALLALALGFYAGLLFSASRLGPRQPV